MGRIARNESSAHSHRISPLGNTGSAAHALIHGGAVYLITGQLVYGLIETVSHWLIDFAKCEGKISMHVDQALHILLKLSYSLLIASQLPSTPALTRCHARL